MQKIQKQTYEQERALYALKNAIVEECVFSGPEDGESPLKESNGVQVRSCRFDLRYPLWHATDVLLQDSRLSVLCRAPMWYCRRLSLVNVNIEGVKAVRECAHVHIKNSTLHSEEFGWQCKDIQLEDSHLVSPYAFLHSRNLRIKGLKLGGKYTFQYVKDCVIEDSNLDTKDAFWHSENVTVKNSVIKGEYLGWYSKNLHLINCHIIGTQPLCYCEGLVLENCTTEGCDLAFEYSEVQADIRGHVDSVKNPSYGKVVCDSVGSVIFEDAVRPTEGKVIIRGE